MRDELMNALKEAMKARDTRRISTIRMVQAAIKDLDIASRTKADSTVTDGDIASLLSMLVKQREESARIYDDGGRPELAAQEREEIAIISGFMPKPEAEVGHCVHRIALHPSKPDTLFMQKHWDVMRSDNAGD